MEGWWGEEATSERLLGLARRTSPLYAYHGPTVTQVLAQLKQRVYAIDAFFYAIKANPHPQGDTLFINELFL